jgi:hypothetical protein
MMQKSSENKGKIMFFIQGFLILSCIPFFLQLNMDGSSTQHRFINLWSLPFLFVAQGFAWFLLCEKFKDLNSPIYYSLEYKMSVMIIVIVSSLLILFS